MASTTPEFIEYERHAREHPEYWPPAAAQFQLTLKVGTRVRVGFGEERLWLPVVALTRPRGVPHGDWDLTLRRDVDGGDPIFYAIKGRNVLDIE
jgi:hypothetical protein